MTGAPSKRDKVLSALEAIGGEGTANEISQATHDEFGPDHHVASAQVSYFCVREDKVEVDKNGPDAAIFRLIESRNGDGTHDADDVDEDEQTTCGDCGEKFASEHGVQVHQARSDCEPDDVDEDLDEDEDVQDDVDELLEDADEEDGYIAPNPDVDDVDELEDVEQLDQDEPQPRRGIGTRLSDDELEILETTAADRLDSLMKNEAKKKRTAWLWVRARQLLGRGPP